MRKMRRAQFHVYYMISCQLRRIVEKWDMWENIYLWTTSMIIESLTSIELHFIDFFLFKIPIKLYNYIDSISSQAVELEWRKLCSFNYLVSAGYSFTDVLV